MTAGGGFYFLVMSAADDRSDYFPDKFVNFFGRAVSFAVKAFHGNIRVGKVGSKFPIGNVRSAQMPLILFVPVELSTVQVRSRVFLQDELCAFLWRYKQGWRNVRPRDAIKPVLKFFQPLEKLMANFTLSFTAAGVAWSMSAGE